MPYFPAIFSRKICLRRLKTEFIIGNEKKIETSLSAKSIHLLGGMSMKKAISTDKAPAAIGPYSQAIEVNGMVYTSGVIPVVPSTGEIPEGAAAQADQAIGNLAALLKEAGTSTENVVKTTVFIKNMEDFGTINEVYAKYFTGTYPARSCVEVARLPKDVLIEIEAIAIK